MCTGSGRENLSAWNSVAQLIGLHADNRRLQDLITFLVSFMESRQIQYTFNHSARTQQLPSMCYRIQNCALMPLATNIDMLFLLLCTLYYIVWFQFVCRIEIMAPNKWTATLFCTLSIIITAESFWKYIKETFLSADILLRPCSHL